MNSKHLAHITAAIKLLKEHADECFVSKAEATLSASNLQSVIDEDELVTFSQIRGLVDEILNEVDRAERKYPDWPIDKIYAAAIVSEESGELIRAAVQVEMENGDIEEMRKEAVQTAATCIRLILNIHL